MQEVRVALNGTVVINYPCSIRASGWISPGLVHQKSRRQLELEPVLKRQMPIGCFPNVEPLLRVSPILRVLWIITPVPIDNVRIYMIRKLVLFGGRTRTWDRAIWSYSRVFGRQIRFHVFVRGFTGICISSVLIAVNRPSYGWANIPCSWRALGQINQWT